MRWDMAIDLEVKTDLTDSTNEIIKNTLGKPAEETGKTFSTLLGFFNNTVLYPLRKYNLYAEDKLKKYSEELENRLKQIPSEELVEPSINILGPIMDGLKYNLDEMHIKEMFINIMTADMNRKTKSRVLPSYAECIKQISSDDALFLRQFVEANNSIICSIQIILDAYENNRSKKLGHTALDSYYTYTYFEKNISREAKVNEIITDNLIRLNIINIDYDSYYPHLDNEYEKLFNSVKRNYQDLPVRYEKGSIALTEYGRNLIEICFNCNLKK